MRHAVDVMDKIFVPLAPGLDGRIGGLTIDEGHEPDRSEILIDCLIVNLAKGLDLDEN